MKLARLAWSTMAAAALLLAPAAFAQGVVVDGDPVVASASSDSFRLDTREGPFESDGTETLAFSTLWHGTSGSSVRILQSGAAAPVAEGLVGESNFVWRTTANGTFVLTHETDGPSDGSAPETATFIVRGLYPDPSATLRWKYAKNANGWFCAQVALTWHPGYAAGITNMRLLFADRYEDQEPLAVIKTLDDEQAAFFPDFRLIKLIGNDGKYYFVNDDTGKVYTESFVERGYREKLDERPTVISGDEDGTVSDWGSSINSDSYITNGVLNDAGAAFFKDISVSTATVTVKFASTPRGLGRRTAYLVDPATVIDPVGTTETYRDIEYRVAPIDLDDFSDLGAGDRAVYGVSDETMASPLASVPKSERKICLRVPNRQLQTVGLFLGKQIAWLAWDDGGEPRFLPLVGSWDSAETETAPQPAPPPGLSFGAPLSRPASLDEANAAESFGLPLAAVATAKVTCRIATMGFGADGSVEGTFEIAAEDAGRVVAESGEISEGMKLTVLGATSLGGAFKPLDPAAFGVELLSRRPPYAFRVKAPGDNAFFKVRLEAEDVYE